MKKLFEKLYTGSRESFYSLIKNNILNNKKMFIVTANPETFMISKNDKCLYDMLISNDVSLVPDGVGLVKASRIVGIPVVERITGIDISLELLRIANEFHNSVYLFGAKSQVINDLKKYITNNYPNINVLGCKDGYVKDRDAVFKDILKKKPDIILVALGIPYQEKIIHKYFDKFDNGIFIGVGGSFDVMSGHKKRAPKLFIKLNLEWLYRICSEPSRLKRFYDSNIKFIFDILIHKKKYM